MDKFCKQWIDSVSGDGNCEPHCLKEIWPYVCLGTVSVLGCNQQEHTYMRLVDPVWLVD